MCCRDKQKVVKRTGTDSILESKNLGGQLLVDVIAFVQLPEISIASLFDQVLKGNQTDNGLLANHVLVQEVQAQVEVRLGQGCEGLDQNVVDNLIVGQMCVELVPKRIFSIGRMSSRVRHSLLSKMVPRWEAHSDPVSSVHGSNQTDHLVARSQK